MSKPAQPPFSLAEKSSNVILICEPISDRLESQQSLPYVPLQIILERNRVYLRFLGLLDNSLLQGWKKKRGEGIYDWILKIRQELGMHSTLLLKFSSGHTEFVTIYNNTYKPSIYISSMQILNSNI